MILFGLPGALYAKMRHLIQVCKGTNLFKIFIQPTLKGHNIGQLRATYVTKKNNNKKNNAVKFAKM